MGRGAHGLPPHGPQPSVDMGPMLELAAWGFVTWLDLKISLKVLCHLILSHVTNCCVCEKTFAAGECSALRLPQGADTVSKLFTFGHGSFSEAFDSHFCSF